MGAAGGDEEKAEAEVPFWERGKETTATADSVIICEPQLLPHSSPNSAARLFFTRPQRSALPKCKLSLFVCVCF